MLNVIAELHQLHRHRATVLIVCLFAVCASGQAKQSVTIGSVRFQPVPVEILGVEVDGTKHKLSEVSPRKFEASFNAPENWLRNMAVIIKNTTDKVVVGVKLQGSLSTGTVGETAMAADMLFGQELDESAFTGRTPHGEPQLLPPGETGAVRRTAAEYEQLVKFLSGKHPADSYRMMRVDVTEVRFDDSTVWSQGKLYRIDPDDPRKWTPIRGDADSRPKTPRLGANEKIITIHNNPRQPTDGALRIIEVKVAGRAVTPNRPFAADDNWLVSLSLRIKNTSAKPIQTARLHLSLPETKYRAGGVGTSLQYGRRSFGRTAPTAAKSLMPGEEAELSFVTDEFESTRNHIRTHGGIDIVRHVRLGTAVVTFADGTVVLVSNLFDEAQPSSGNDAKQP